MMKLLLLIFLTGCASEMKEEFWEDVGNRCPPEECSEGESNSYNKKRMSCECIPVATPN